MLSVTHFLACVMVSKAVDGTSLGALNSILPNLSEAA